MTQHEMRQPLSLILNAQYETSKEENDDHEGDELEGELPKNDVGDVKTDWFMFCVQLPLTWLDVWCFLIVR